MITGSHLETYIIENGYTDTVNILFLNDIQTS